MKADKAGKFTVEDIQRDIMMSIDDPNVSMKEVLKAYFEKKLGCNRLILPFWKATFGVDTSLRREQASQLVEAVYDKYGVGYTLHVDSYKNEHENVWRIQILQGLSNAAYLVKHDDTKYLLKEIYGVLHGEYKNYASVEPNGILYTFNIDMNELKEFVENYVETPEKIFTESTPF